MELTGNDASRWEQMSNSIQTLEQKIASYHELIKGISSSLAELTTSLEETRQTAYALSNLAYKEVLRQESGTINADDDYDTPIVAQESSQPEPITQLNPSASEVVARPQLKNESKATPKKPRRTTKSKAAVNQVGLLDDSDKE